MSGEICEGSDREGKKKKKTPRKGSMKQRHLTLLRLERMNHFHVGEICNPSPGPSAGRIKLLEVPSALTVCHLYLCSNLKKK